MDRQKTTIVNIKKTKEYDVYIGRENKWLGLPQSKWANPFPMKNESQRQEVIAKYKKYILGCSALLEDLHELEGKVLGCYCAPKDCHGRILLELLEERKNGNI